jgi:glycosyltransferase involved in cell wall biosynthesis
MIRFSILIPTFNNLDYLKLAIQSINANSVYDHEVILHINDGSDGTLNFAKTKNLLFSHSEDNIGLCSAINNASKIATTNYILYVHDDMYLCKNWDLFLEKEINDLNDDLFYFSGTNYSSNSMPQDMNPGDTPFNFDNIRFDKFCLTSSEVDLQGSHWAPHITSKRLWDLVGGFSEEFNPGDGSDPDFCMKLWKEKVRIFKSINKFKVFHFGSMTTRKKKIIKNNGTKIFITKYGFNPKFFRKFYLRGGATSIYDGPLKKPKISLAYLFELFFNKLKFIYYKILIQ